MSPVSSPDFSFDPQLFSSTFLLIALAELPDKTAFATVLLATRRHPGAVFVGVAGAFFVQSLVAVIFGGALTLVPAVWLRGAAGLMFLGFAAVCWFKRGKDVRDESEAAIEAAGEDPRGRKSATQFWKTVGSAFTVIFLAEWGDLTQLATATLEAEQRKPLTIFLAATLALWFVSALAIWVGSRLKGRLDPRLISRFAAVAFAGVGGRFLWQAFAGM